MGSPRLKFLLHHVFDVVPSARDFRGRIAPSMRSDVLEEVVDAVVDGLTKVLAGVVVAVVCG